MSTLHPLAYAREAERLYREARLYAADGYNKTARRLKRRADHLELMALQMMDDATAGRWIASH